MLLILSIRFVILLSFISVSTPSSKTINNNNTKKRIIAMTPIKKKVYKMYFLFKRRNQFGTDKSKHFLSNFTSHLINALTSQRTLNLILNIYLLEIYFSKYLC